MDIVTKRIKTNQNKFVLKQQKKYKIRETKLNKRRKISKIKIIKIENHAIDFVFSWKHIYMIQFFN
jgi:hypothetical protein